MDTRQAFEAWVTSHGGSSDRTDGGEYRSSPTECAWSAWQAATERAAKVCDALHIVTATTERLGTSAECAAAIRAGS